VVDLSDRPPILQIPAEAENGNRDRLLPTTPAFATCLLSVTEAERRGSRVLKLLGNDGKPLRGERCLVGKTVIAIGKAAGIVVDAKTKGETIVREFASAHDLRIVRPTMGRKDQAHATPRVMRNASINTMLDYYVDEDAEATADGLRASFGDALGDTPSAHKKRDTKSTEKTSTGERT
jgi:hypothetical protein